MSMIAIYLTISEEQLQWLYRKAREDKTTVNQIIVDMIEGRRVLPDRFQHLPKTAISTDITYL